MTASKPSQAAAKRAARLDELRSYERIRNLARCVSNHMERNGGGFIYTRGASLIERLRQELDARDARMIETLHKELGAFDQVVIHQIAKAIIVREHCTLDDAKRKAEGMRAHLFGKRSHYE